MLSVGPPAGRAGLEIMLRSLLISLLSGLVISGCANGWPSARHPGPSRAHTAQNCVPTTSHISRTDCGTSAPGSQNSGEDLERTRNNSQNAGQMGGLSAPR